MTKKKISNSVIKITQKTYTKTLIDIKKQISQARLKAIFAVNKELVKLYWNIGRTISQLQIEHGWGSKIIEKLASDIQSEFPGLEGFSRANISYMKSFYQTYAIVQQPVGQLENLPIFSIPWGHNIILISQIRY